MALHRIRFPPASRDHSILTTRSELPWISPWLRMFLQLFGVCEVLELEYTT